MRNLWLVWFEVWLGVWLTDLTFPPKFKRALRKHFSSRAGWRQHWKHWDHTYHYLSFVCISLQKVWKGGSRFAVCVSEVGGWIWRDRGQLLLIDTTDRTQMRANPMRLLQRIKRIQEELPLLKSECQAIVAAKQVRQILIYCWTIPGPDRDLLYTHFISEFITVFATKSRISFRDRKQSKGLQGFHWHESIMDTGGF